MIELCRACGADGLQGFYGFAEVPANSCLLLDSAAEARGFPTGSIDLAFCATCGFITNRAFDAGLAEYSDRYEETQGYSARFVDFGRQLATSWVERYDLRGGHVLEVGCGKGEFLTWMVEAGVGTGTGVDPGVDLERFSGLAAERIEWITDVYDERWAGVEADAVVCRHTLEHIHPVADFLGMIRRNLGDRTETVVLFELPDVLRVLEEVAFWDVYYEHCSYFTAGSLARLFRRCGFEVLAVSSAFADQYLLLEARPSTGGSSASSLAIEDDLDRLAAATVAFSRGVEDAMTYWHRELSAVSEAGGRTVVWGGGSKAVAFLTGLGIGEHVAGAVDINPYKQGRYIAGSGHRVMAPKELVELLPDLVVAMNPIYLDEIREALDAMELHRTRLVAL